MSEEELREQLALHAVGALTDAERMELDDVLRTRPDLQDELAELQAAAAVLAEAIPTTPPSTLRVNILDAIAETPQLPVESRPATPVLPTAPPPSPLAPVVPIGAARSRSRFVPIGAAAAAVVAIVVGVLVVSPWSGGQSDSIAAVVEAPDAVEIPMPGTGEAGSLPGLTIVHSASEDAAVLRAESVPIPEGDRVYELWAIRDGSPERYATFRPDQDGRLIVYADGLDPASAERWAITEEPAGGSDVPTGAILNVT